jgi:hypothetical protein
MMDFLGPESLMLYFAVVLVLLALSIWRYSGTTLVAEATSHKSGYVMMSGGSQAVLKMDPRRGGAADAADAHP